jgi:hypothetical protein
VIEVADIADALAETWGVHERQQPEDFNDMLDQLGVEQPVHIAAGLRRCATTLLRQQPALLSAPSAVGFGLRCGFAMGVRAQRTASGDLVDIPEVTSFRSSLAELEINDIAGIGRALDAVAHQLVNEDVGLRDDPEGAVRAGLELGFVVGVRAQRGDEV